MLADSQYAFLAIGGPSIALAVGVLWCILNRQRRKRALRFDDEVENATFETETSPSTSSGNEDQVGGDTTTEGEGMSSGPQNPGIRKRKLYQPTDDALLDRTTEFQILGSSTGFEETQSSSVLTEQNEGPGHETEPNGALSEPEVPIITTTCMSEAEPTLIAPPAQSINTSPIQEADTTAEDFFWKHCHNDSLCRICGAAFTVWTRRHHCRKCFASVCAGCSANTASLPGWEDKQRICNPCWEQLTAASPSLTPTATTESTESVADLAAPLQEEIRDSNQEQEQEEAGNETPPANPQIMEEINPLIGQSAFVMLGNE